MRALTVKFWFAAMLSALVAGVSIGSASGASQAWPANFVCPTNFVLRFPVRCSQSKKAEKTIEMALLGLAQEKPLPTTSIESFLSYIPFKYLRVTGEGASIYPSLESARRGGGSADHTSPGFIYLSYPDNGIYQDQEAIVFQSQRGYVRGDNVARVTPSAFEGLAFSRKPERPFRWIISGDSWPERVPGGEADYADRCFMRYEVIQIYGEQLVDDQTWYLIGLDLWLPSTSITVVQPDPSRPTGVEGDRWISVNLDQQAVAAYAAGELVYATLSSTDRYGTRTQPGAFQVWAKLQRDNMTGGLDEGYYYLEDVPWALYFDQSRALHGTYWHNQFGAPNSRGCVNLSITDARWFFEFSQEGTWVYVWDPPGETPTDPALYSAGGV